MHLDIREIEYRGWKMIRLRTKELEVDLVPGKGADILQVRWLPDDLDLLWSTPWGLRERGSVSTSGDSYANFMENYPGGWQTVFPNGGRESVAGGVRHGFHGEACLASWDWQITRTGVELSTRLVRSPFRLTKMITLEGSRLRVDEVAENVGGEPFDAVWCHHPAFGAPFLGRGSRLDTAARGFINDESPTGDLDPGHESEWPYAVGRSGEKIDLRVLPGSDAGIARLGYLTDFDRGWAAITSHEHGVRAELEWNTDVLPHAWLWLESNASPGFPVYKGWYVMAIEPASSYPAQGIDEVSKKGSGLLAFEPSESRTATVSLTVSPTDSKSGQSETP